MKTSKNLIELIPEVLEWTIVKHEGQVAHNAKMIEILGGQLLKHVEESMSKELNAKAFARARERISPINITRQVTNKQSATYIKEPTRSLVIDNKKDQELLDKFQKNMKLNQKLQYASEILNLCKYVALELYASEGKPDCRVLTPEDFLVYSDSKVNPNEMTVFIKFMGTKPKLIQAVDSDGKSLANKEAIIRDTNIFHLYSETEFVEVDADGEVTDYKEHGLGRIPFIYIKNTQNELLPVPDSDNLAMSILIPKLLSDLNYAIQFQSHSIVYAIDVDPSQMDGNPDSVWLMKSEEGEGKSPQLGTIDPKVDSDKVMSLISQQLIMWLETKGLKTSGVGKVEASASGIAKAIDEADTTALREKQTSIWADAEQEFWQLASILQDSWSKNGEVDSPPFSSKFEVSVTFAEQKPVINTLELLAELKLMFELGLTSIPMALQRMYPDKDDKEITKMLEDIKAFNEEQKANKPPIEVIEDVVKKDEENKEDKEPIEEDKDEEGKD